MAREKAKASNTWELAGRSVAVSHLDKVYWPQDGLTKGDMLDYYRRMSPVLRLLRRTTGHLESLSGWHRRLLVLST